MNAPTVRCTLKIWWVTHGLEEFAFDSIAAARTQLNKWLALNNHGIGRWEIWTDPRPEKIDSGTPTKH